MSVSPEDALMVLDGYIEWTGRFAAALEDDDMERAFDMLLEFIDRQAFAAQALDSLAAALAEDGPAEMKRPGDLSLVGCGEPQRLACAWCKKVMREGREPQTDGICAECQSKLMAEWRAS